ncbi:MAG: hypothetical protein U0X75_20610 [Acidobacteriota bacterium]
MEKDDPDTLTILEERAANDPVPKAKTEEWQSGVRDVALQHIVRGWPDDPETLALLRERAERPDAVAAGTGQRTGRQT